VVKIKCWSKSKTQARWQEAMSCLLKVWLCVMQVTRPSQLHAEKKWSIMVYSSCQYFVG
jgi:hypothetical protein